MAYVVVTDTALDIEEEFLVQHGICTVPFTFTLDQYDTVEDDFGKSVPYTDVYHQLEKEKDAVSVQPSGVSLTNAFEGILKSNRDVLYVGTSSSLNDSYRSACRVGDLLNQKYPFHQVYCVDSHCIAGGQALLMREIVKRKALGDSIEQLVDWIDSFSSHICHWFVSEQFSGWRNTPSYMLSFLNSSGTLVPFGKMRNRKKMLDTLAKQFYAHVQQLGQYPVILSHSGCPQDADYLAGSLLQHTASELKQIECYFMNPAMACHVGTNALGLFFYGDGRTK